MAHTTPACSPPRSLHTLAAEHIVAICKCYRLLLSKVENFMSMRRSEFPELVSEAHTSESSSAARFQHISGRTHSLPVC